MEFASAFGPETYCNTEIREQVPDTRVEIVSYEKLLPTGEDRLVFDLIHAPASHANALRRTLLAGVPSMCMDDMIIHENTGTMPDEVLAHRIGLIPLNANPSDFGPDDYILFGLHVIGGEGPDPDLTGVDSTWEGELPPFYTGESGVVLSDHFVWMPHDGQYEMGLGVLHPGVPVTKLLPGQRIHLYVHALKGCGAEHAKFSPVCTAFYRLVPKIEVAREASDDELIVKTCPMHVFEIEDTGELVAKYPRRCTMCRECQRVEGVKNYIRLGKEPNHYEFTVESIGARPAPALVMEALQILNDECGKIRQAVDDAKPQ